MSTPTPDWGLGHYESTAAQLLPAAQVVVDHADPAPREHVVDVGCGTGNATLLAAERGARVTGVDPAVRLLDVAREEAAARGLEATFAEGHAAAIPLADGDADVVLSVFGVIFAPDPVAAAADMARVVAPSGRIVLSAWIPEGTITSMAREASQTVARVLGQGTGRTPFSWHDRDALAGLLGPHRFEVHTSEHELAFTAASPRDYLEAFVAEHPLSVAGSAVLEARGEAEALFQRLLEILETGNEDPDGFRVTSRYVVATARRG